MDGAGPLKFDVAIIGGGIIGAGVARDATLRGLRVALVEMNDFGSGTTSRSTRLIHGGLRYLSKYDFSLVGEALRERRLLLRNAPHLVRPMPFLLPKYRGSGHAVPILWAGITAYDYLDPHRSLPHHRFLPPETCLRLEPRLRRQGLQGGFLYYDSQCAFPERLCLENALDAAENGARIMNHTRAVRLLHADQGVKGLEIEDVLAGRTETIETRAVLNCAGPWLDEVERVVDAEAAPRLRRTKGIHLVVPRQSEHALIIETRDSDRVVFSIPWGDLSLIGTTDTDYEGANDDVRADAADVSYLLDEINSVLREPIPRKDILFTTAGLRPLQRQVGRSTADITRRHDVIDHAETGGPAGYLTVVGGKITTYRAIAEDVVDRLVRRLGVEAQACTTQSMPLPGGRIDRPWPDFLRRVLREAARRGVDSDVGRHLADRYGARALPILGRIAAEPEAAGRVDANFPTIWAEVDHAVEAERARTLEDVLLRRLALGLQTGQARSAAERVASRVSTRLGWDPRRTRAEVSSFLAALDRNWTPVENVNP